MAMNTKTMRLPPRRVLTPTGSASGSVTTNNNNKRKERDEGFDRLKASSTVTAAAATKFLKPDKPRAGFEPTALTATKTKGLEQPPPPSANNQLLAGYLAHEFITKGTLFGQVWDPSRAAEGPPTFTTEKRKASKPRPKGEAEPEKVQRYVEVASLLKMDGAHLRNVVNPTELAQFLQL